MARNLTPLPPITQHPNYPPLAGAGFLDVPESCALGNRLYVADFLPSSTPIWSRTFFTSSMIPSRIESISPLVAFSFRSSDRPR